jgi:hypothetical protein
MGIHNSINASLPLILSTSRLSSSPLLCLDNRRLGLCKLINFRIAQFSVSKPISVSPKNRDSRSWKKHNWLDNCRFVRIGLQAHLCLLKYSGL